MSKIEVSFKKNVLTINKKNTRKDNKNIEKIDISTLDRDVEYESKITATSEKEKNKIFLKMKMKDKSLNNISEDEEIFSSEDSSMILVYSQNGKIKYIHGSENKVYKKIIKLRYKVMHMSLNKKYLKLKILAYIVNPYDIKINETKFYIDELLGKKCDLKQYKQQISKLEMLKDKNIYIFKFKMDDILSDESIINGAIRFTLNIDKSEIDYKIGKFNKRIKEKKYYNLPMKSIYVKDFAVHIRRTIAGNLVLVKRKVEDIEKTFKFRLMESKFVSFMLYNIGKICTKLRKKKINLFYEKFAAKAEEGVYDICKLCKNSDRTKNYFVIDKNSPYYAEIKNDKNVIVKNSFKFYWLFYNTNCFIASEAPSHLNVLRSNNKYFRKATYDKKFVFLQHGIIYMKNLGINSTFSKQKEGESNYMVVSSEKERDVVVEMLGYDEEQLIKTGLGMYSKIEYNHINQKSDNIVTIMLTWKPYEEQLYDFEKSSYYKNVVDIYNMLAKYMKKDNIIIIGHPKAYSLLVNTGLKNSLWNKPISKALEKTKLLITDYSSVCYNSFYQGAGVIFYQEDLEKYEAENGKLIPNNDEYIGKRAFNLKELESIIKETIENNNIKLDKVRTKEFENNYKTINEFTDGKNIDRIYEKLVELKLV